MQISLPSLRLLVLTSLFALCALLPLTLHAQTSTSSELSATIRAQLLSDPRSASLSEAQLSAMVDLLSQEAQKQGLTAQAIEWHPNPTTLGANSTNSGSTGDICNGSYTCLVDEAFGLVGPDTTIPFFLGMASMGLIWILAEMLHRHKYPHVSVPPAAPTSGM